MAISAFRMCCYGNMGLLLGAILSVLFLGFIVARGDLKYCNGCLCVTYLFFVAGNSRFKRLIWVAKEIRVHYIMYSCSIAARQISQDPQHPPASSSNTTTAILSQIYQLCPLTSLQLLECSSGM